MVVMEPQHRAAEVRLDESKPFAPDIQKNPTKAYFLARDRLSEFKPTLYFGYWDLETFEEHRVRDTKSVGTILMSKITPFTIATAFHTKSGDVSNYTDIRSGPDFVHRMIAYMFEMAQQVAADNAYPANIEAELIREEAKATKDKKLRQKLMHEADLVDIPYSWQEVPILGYNSSKFDMNLILHELNCDEWKVLQQGLMIGGVSSFKKIRVQHNKTGIVLVFLDAKNFGSGTQSKGMFPYEAINSINYNEYLSSATPSPIKDFASELKSQDATPDEYANIYVKGWAEAKTLKMATTHPSKSVKSANAPKPARSSKMPNTALKSPAPPPPGPQLLNPAAKFTRWDHIEHYNKNDVEIMIKPILYLIQSDFKQGVDMLQYFSRASIAIAERNGYLYRNFNINEPYEDYVTGKPYYFNRAKCRQMCYRYQKQDETAKRDIKNIVSIDDFESLKSMFCGNEHITIGTMSYNQGECKGCNKRFSTILTPTLDRIDNNKCHSIDNVYPSCAICNVKHNNRPIEDVMLPIKLHCYALKNNFPFTIDSEKVYHLLRKFTTGGIANVHRKYTKVGETKITNLQFSNPDQEDQEAFGQAVFPVETKNVVTHIAAYDAMSLYPSSTCSKEHPLNPYTDHKMFMPARLIGYYNATDKPSVKSKIMDIINDRTSKTTFFVTVKGAIKDVDAINNCINFPPIIRNKTIDINEETLGPTTMNQINNAKAELTKLKEADKALKPTKSSAKPSAIPPTIKPANPSKSERKLTQMIDTNGEFIGFNNYLLWYLIDTHKFVIEDVEELALFTRTDCFEGWYKYMIDQRNEYIDAENTGGSNYIKMSMNSSYGFDMLNEEKYSHTKLVSKDKAWACIRRKNFTGMRQITNDLYFAAYKPRTYKCKTCLHCGVFTLDNSKFWLLNFIYNSVYKCVDRTKIMVIYCDTDCVTFAIAGDNTKPIDQGFSAIITDQEFWDANAPSVLPIHTSIKRLLAFDVENIGDEMIALAPKNYILRRVQQYGEKKDIPPTQTDAYKRNPDGSFKMGYKVGLKGVNKYRNAQINYDAFKGCYESGTIVMGQNCGFHPLKAKSLNADAKTMIPSSSNLRKDYVVVKSEVNKVALSGVHTKMVVMADGVCAPFIYGLTSKNYR
ncbi:hypothetical protein FACS189472_07320 [Alphaproteobacteria bacterium]|nr:hypothetical protein FACS189472_07320 [Alphaproteobacteria bacterium]